MPIWVLIVLSVALVALWVGTRRPIVGALAIVAIAWLTVDYFNLSGWVVFWAALAAVLIVLFVASRMALFAALAVVVVLVATGLGVHSWNEGAGDRLAAAIQQQLNDNNKQFTYAESCTDAKLKPLCEKINSNTKGLGDVKADVDKLKKRVGILEQNEKSDAKATVIKSAGGVTDAQASKALGKALADAGWKPGDIRVNNVDETQHTEQAGTYRYSKDRLRTKSKLVSYLNGTSPAASANRNLILGMVPASERARLLSGEGYYNVQFMKDSCLSGNTYYKDGKVYTVDSICHKKGDIIWVYVGSNGNVYWGATVRDDCGNGHLNSAPTPKSPPTPNQPTPTPPQPTKPTPTTPTPTQPTPTTTPPTPTPTKCPGKVCQTPPPPPTNRPPAGPPTGPAENKPPKETNPANPADKPGSGSTLPAPGSTPVPTQSGPAAPTHTGAPSPSAPVTSNPDPDGN